MNKYNLKFVFNNYIYRLRLEAINKYTPAMSFFDSPFSNFRHKKGTMSKKGIFGTKFVICVKKKQRV